MLTCLFRCLPAESVGGGGDTFDDDGGGDGRGIAGWTDTAGSPQQSVQTQGISAAQASEASQVSSATLLANLLLQYELKRHSKHGYSEWVEVYVSVLLH